MQQGQQGGLSDASSGGVAGAHPVDNPFHILVAPSTEDQTNALTFPLTPILCWKVEDVRFAFDSSFVSYNTDPATNPTDNTSDPDAMPFTSNGDIRDELLVLANQVLDNPGCPLSIFGHADPVGPATDPDGYNKALAGRRATSIYAVLISGTQLQTAIGLWQGISQQEHWGDKQTSVMQQATNLPNGTSMNTLIANYLPKLCPPELKLKPTDFLAQGTGPGGKGDYQGCSSFNPLLVFSQTKEDSFADAVNDKDQATYDARNMANAPNRRVMVLIFNAGSKVDPAKWPCPSATGSKAGCIAQFWPDGDDRRHRRDPDADRRFGDKKDTFACRFYQRMMDDSPCYVPRELMRVRILDQAGAPRVALNCNLAIDGKTTVLTTDGLGILYIDLPGSAQTAFLEIDGKQTELLIPKLASIREISGVQARLKNLGYFYADVDGTMGDSTRDALLHFQSDNLSRGLGMSGTIDDATRAEIRLQHGY